MQKADTAEKQRKANDYVDCVNTIVDFYNSVENLQQQVNNLQMIVKYLCEYMDIREEDITTLQTINASFLRNKMCNHIEDNLRWGDRNWFHFIAYDYEESERVKSELQFYENLSDNGYDGQTQTLIINLIDSIRQQIYEYEK